MNAVRRLMMLLVVGGSAAGAQNVPKAQLRDSNLVARNVLRILFDGITLSIEQEEKATAIIKRTWREQFAPKSGTSAERLNKGLELNAARDSLLKALLKPKADRARFERNAAALTEGIDSGSHGSSPPKPTRSRAFGPW